MVPPVMVTKAEKAQTRPGTFDIFLYKSGIM
jgi:hypothetical protein